MLMYAMSFLDLIILTFVLICELITYPTVHRSLPEIPRVTPPQQLAEDGNVMAYSEEKQQIVVYKTYNTVPIILLTDSTCSKVFYFGHRPLLKLDFAVG